MQKNEIELVARKMQIAKIDQISFVISQMNNM